MDDPRPAGAGEPDIPAVSPAVEVPAALVLSDKGHQGGQNFWHGPGRLAQAQQIGKSPKARPLEGGPSPSGGCRVRPEHPGTWILT